MRRLFAFITCLVIVSMLSCAHGATICVATTGNDTTGNGSVSAPYRTIQFAIGKAVNADTVQVAVGTYIERINFLGKAITVTSSDPNSQSVVAATIIDGNQGGSVVCFVSSETPASVITGFTIRNGKTRYGGGIYCQNSSPTITRNVIRANYTDNTVMEPPGRYAYGGGICCIGGAAVITYNTILENNGCVGSGVASLDDASITVSHNTIADNNALSGGGGVCCWKGDAVISDNVISGNYSTGWAGGGILVQRDAVAVITNNIITCGTADRGGGVCFIEGSSGTMTGNVISDNVSKSWGGGGVYLRTWGTVSITNEVISGNRSQTEGGGGILCEGNGAATVTNCTIAQNVALANGGGVCAEYGAKVTIKNSIVHSNTGPKAANLAIWGYGAQMTVSYVDVGGGQAGVYNDGALLVWQAGNIDTDPFFAQMGVWNNAGTPNNVLDDTWTDGDYHLKSGSGRWDPDGGGSGVWVCDAVSSLCIDAGDPVSAYSNEPSPNGDRINMGAYGNTQYASKSPVKLTMAVSPPGDGGTVPAPGTYDTVVAQPQAIQALPLSNTWFVNWTASPSLNASFADADSESTTVAATDNVTVTANFSRTVAEPSFTPPSGPYNAPFNVTINCRTPAAEIHYTTDGSTPTAGSTLYTGPINVSSTKTIKAIAIKTGLLDSAVVVATYQIDTQGPVARDLSTIPTSVRAGRDTSLTLNATGDDSAAGNVNIAAAEYFIGADPGPGDGTAMSAADGVFNSPVEALTATVNTTSWTVIGVRRINVRARDAAGNWSPSVAHIDVPVVDGTPPGAITDLSASATGSLMALACAVHECSSDGPGTPAVALLDGNAATAWRTVGTVSPEAEYVILDVSSVKPLSAIALLPSVVKGLFPSEFAVEVSSDDVSWTKVAATNGFKVTKGSYVWQFETADARFVKIHGPGMLNPSDRRFYWEIAGASVYTGGGAFAQLMWTAPADDGFTGTPASQYEVRYSGSVINEVNFAAADVVEGITLPKIPGTLEQMNVLARRLTGLIFFAVKTADEIPNWSSLSNVVSLKPAITGFASMSPADGAAGSTQAPSTFVFAADSTAKPVSIVFSSCPEFVAKPVARPGGGTDKSIKFPVKPGALSWTPSSGQWKSIKKIVSDTGILYWRLEGPCAALGTVFGPTRCVVFDTGVISGLTVSPRHTLGADDAVWPDAQNPPGFFWVDGTNAMKYFFVDVSTEPEVPLADKKKTLALGGAGVSVNYYSMSKADWKKVRQLASRAGGTLYWRVRALDADKTMSCPSAPRKLIVDGGLWALTDFDPNALPPTVGWTHTGAGIVRYNLQFSAGDQFEPTARKTVTIPPRAIPTTVYTLTAADLTRLHKLADTNAATTLYYRVRGEDAEKAFVAYSGSKTVDIP